MLLCCWWLCSYEQDRHSGIAELLEILGSIINGFALPLKHEHKLFLRKVLIPMHKVRSLHHFHQQLSYCVSQFVDKDPELAVPVLSGLLQYWPISNSSKEVLFLNELEQILELTQPEEFGLLVPALFRRVAVSIASPHFQVAERALFLWHNEYISHLIAQHREEILPILYPVLSASSAPVLSSLNLTPTPPDSSTDAPSTESGEVTRGAHWNPTVNNLTMNVLKIFVELDAALVDSVKAELREKEEKQERERKWREREWRRLEEEEAIKRRDGLERNGGARAASPVDGGGEDKEEVDESEVHMIVTAEAPTAQREDHSIASQSTSSSSTATSLSSSSSSLLSSFTSSPLPAAAESS